MPPAISDDERSSPLSGDEDVLPPKKPATKKSAAKSKAKPVKENVVDDEDMTDVKNGDAEVQDDGEDDEDDSDEYVVEKILSHAPGQGKTTLYEVKWLGYENLADRTWEPEENLEGAKDILQAYWDSIGGKPEPKPKTPAKKGTKRKSAAASQDTPEVSTSSTKRRGRKAPKTEDEAAADGDKTVALPEGSWEDHVQGVDAIEISEEGEHKGSLMIYLLWENCGRTRHTALQCRSKCPNKLLDYYESKLVFKNRDE